jgi:hypothetical protein
MNALAQSSDPVGYRVGEPEKTNALKVLQHEIVEMGNAHLLDDVGKAFNVAPTWDSISNAITGRFGSDAVAIWLTDTKEQAEFHYGPGEAYKVTVPKEAIIICNLGEDGKLWLWSKNATIDVSEEEDSTVEIRSDFVEVRFIMDVPETTGLDGKRTGPYTKDHVYVLPRENADFYVKRSQAEHVRGKAAKPTLKELFSGTTLDSYLERARAKMTLFPNAEKTHHSNDEPLKSFADEVPDVNDPNRINYWKTIDGKQVYMEGWSEKCYAGTGLGEYDTEGKLNHARDLTPQILAKKAKEKGLRLLKGEFIETPDKDFVYGVTVGIFVQESLVIRKWQIRNRADELAKKIREERANHGL